MIREILEKVDSPSTVISGVMSTDLKKAVSLLKDAGFDAFIYQEENIGVKGPNDAKAKAGMQKALKGKISKGFDISEKCTKKKESDGSYGDLGVIPTAPSNLGKDKEHMIVDGDIVDADKIKDKPKGRK